MAAWYRAPRIRWWHALSDAQVAVVASSIVLGVWWQRPVAVVGVAGVVLLAPGWRRVAVVGVVGGLLGAALSAGAWHDVAADRLGDFVGWSCLVTDPAPRQGATVAVFEVEGERFEAWARGSPRRRLAAHLAGECTWIHAERRVIDGVAGRRAAVRHVVGRLDLDSVGDWVAGAPLSRASNRVRRLFAGGADRLGAPDSALFAGLVIGDDRNEPAEMIAEFRRSGLSHLTAVSGANVSFVLAAAAPLLDRLRSVARWLVTLALIGWFVALTRFEPSILRAGVMAAVASTGAMSGRQRSPPRVLALAVGGLVLVDPLLVWAVGFWLSVAATAGVALLSAPLARAVPGPRWLAVPVGVTLAAQLAVAPVTLAVFGTMPLVAIPANLLAVPVAAGIMLYGLPAGLLAGLLAGSSGGAGQGQGWSGHLATLVQLPCAAGTRWVATVAALAARCEPPAPWPGLGWLVLVVVLALRLSWIRRSGVCEG